MPRDRWQRAAVVVWVVALLLLGGKALLRPQAHSVYPIFTGAAHKWLDGASLYKHDPQEDGYRYSPLVAAFFVPFALLPDGVGALLWRLLGAGAFLGGLCYWRRTLLPAPLTRAQEALLFLLPAPLAFANLHNGQANLHVIGLLLLGVAAVADGRFTFAGVCVAVACVFKVYPVAVGLLLVALFPRRFTPRLAVALAVGLLLPFLLQRPEYVASQYGDWLRHMQDNDRQVMSPFMWYRDLRLLCSLWVTPMSYSAYQATQLVGAAVVAAACLWARRAGLAPARLLTLVLGLGCCWMTALGPATESSTYVLIAPTAAGLLVSARAEGHPTVLRGLWLVGYGLLAAAQAAVLLSGEWGRLMHSLGPQPLAGLLFLGGLLYVAFRGDPSPGRLRPGARAFPDGAHARPIQATTPLL
jgi:hypothetical protein